jgi:diguanylate cyclase (GGDEF)-like protein
LPEVLSLSTIFICTAITTGVVALALTYASMLEGRDEATVWWCWGMWVASAGMLLLALRGLLPFLAGVGLGNALVFVGYGLARKGYGIFRDVKTSSVTLWAGAAFWIAVCVTVPDIRDNFSHRIAFSSSIIMTYSVLLALDGWQGWKRDRLPSFVALVVLFSTHALMHCVRACLAILYPVKDVIQGNSSWLAVIGLESYVHAIGISFLFFALSKERAERRYRLAAEIDGLTGAASRRFFVSETRLRLGKTPKAGVLAIIDLDFFKSVNDCYGHLGGDRVLQAFGGFVQERLGAGMVFGRLGGEEFGIYLPDFELSDAREFLDALRGDVEALPIPFMGSPIRITISIGAASVRDVGVDFDHLMAAADGALYLAKEEGRNRLRTFLPTMRLHKIMEEGAETRLGMSEQRLSRMMVRSRVGGK